MKRTLRSMILRIMKSSALSMVLEFDIGERFFLGLANGTWASY